MTTTTALKNYCYRDTSTTELPEFITPSNSMFASERQTENLAVEQDELVMASIFDRFFQKLSTWHGTPDQVASGVDAFLKGANKGTYNVSVQSIKGFKKDLQITIE